MSLQKYDVAPPYGTIDIRDVATLAKQGRVTEAKYAGRHLGTYMEPFQPPKRRLVTEPPRKTTQSTPTRETLAVTAYGREPPTVTVKEAKQAVAHPYYEEIGIRQIAAQAKAGRPEAAKLLATQFGKPLMVKGQYYIIPEKPKAKTWREKGLPEPTATAGFLGPLTPTEYAEWVGSELAFRGVWDPAYRERMEKKWAQWEKERPLEWRREARRQAMRTSETVASIALVAYTGYQLGKLAYFRLRGPRAFAVEYRAKEIVTKPVEKVSRAYRTSRLARFVQEVKFKEPIYTIRKTPKKIATWWYKRFPTKEMALEKAISWEATREPLLLGFKRYPMKGATLELTKTGGTVVTGYPGAELWATWKEAPKNTGYPILRSLTATKIQALRTGIARQIWGPSVIVSPERQIAAFETWVTAKETHPFKGYPVLRRELTSVKIAEEPFLTSWQQIQKAIEKGMFQPVAGVTSARYVPVFGKPTPQVYQPSPTPRHGKKSTFTTFERTFRDVETAIARVETTQATMKPTAPTLIGVEPRHKWFKPKFERVKIEPFVRVPPKTIEWEREKEKFKPLTFVRKKTSTTRKQKQLYMLIPSLKRQKQPPPIPTPQIPKLDFPPPETPPTTTTPKAQGFPLYWRRGGGRDVSRLGRDFWGKWFRREHRLPTSKQMEQRLGLLVGKPKRRRKFKRKGGVPKLWF